MSSETNAQDVRRYYVVATKQELYATGVDFATSVEFDPVNSVFILHPFFPTCTEWLVNEPAAWADKFIAKYPAKRVIELFKSDVARNEDYAVFVTLKCSQRINTPAMQAVANNLLLNIAYGKFISSNN